MIKRFSSEYFQLLKSLTLKEFSLRYKMASLGVLWAFINPFLQMLIIGTVFSLYIKIPNYYVYLLIGLIPWQFFSSSLVQATLSFVSNKNLLEKTVFPREVIPLSIILGNGINLIFSEAILVFYLVIKNQINPSDILLLIPALIMVFIFTAGLSLFTSSAYVRFRDIHFLIQAVLTLWFYATPILYQASALPSAFYQINTINPMSLPIMMIQTALFRSPPPSHNVIWGNLLIISIALFAGIIYFKKTNKNFLDWI